MKEQLVSFETAKLAKEKGFEQLEFSKIYWESKQEEFPFNKALFYKALIEENRLSDETNEQLKICSAPTQSLLQKWLREKHNIQICNNLHYKVGGGIAGHLIDISHPNGDFKSTSIAENTYEEALEKGLQEALKLIKL